MIKNHWSYNKAIDLKNIRNYQPQNNYNVSAYDDLYDYHTTVSEVDKFQCLPHKK